MSARQQTRLGRRGAHLSTLRPRDILPELSLALLPTVIVIAASAAVEALSHERILFASLASSAFLIYRDPAHPMNRLSIMVVSQVIGVVWGVVASRVFSAGYLAAVVAMVGTIVTLILVRAVHPPAVSTTLGFAFLAHQGNAIGYFLIMLVIIVSLILVQQSALFGAHLRKTQDAREQRGD